MKRIGLVVNPIAGIGGRVGLKGSDGSEIQQKARALGALPHAGERAALALRSLASHRLEFELLCAPGAMGEEACRAVNLPGRAVGTLSTGVTSAEDTIRLAKEMKAQGVDLLLFAGGDGTARDIVTAIGQDLPALGIPAGVKIHSGVYATTPRHAGDLAAAFLQGEAQLSPAEVMDLDEQAFREGRVAPRLFGYLRVPSLRRYLQGGKAPAPVGEPAVLADIAEDLKEKMKPGWLYILGPGSTLHILAAQWGVEKTLLGVDALLDGKLVVKDAREEDLLRLVKEHPDFGILVTPIGGQGSLFGRGNQPISPAVIHAVRRENIWIVSTPEKLQALNGAPLWVDTGDPAVDALLCGYYEVITGYKERVMYKVSE